MLNKRHENNTNAPQVLLENLSQGDSSAFWKLWLSHQEYIYQCCLEWMGGDVTDAQDAMSETMLKAWDRLPSHAHKIINLKPWLTRFTYNLCMDIHRGRGRKETGIDNIESSASELISPDMTIDIYSITESLPIRLRLPFIMRFEQDLSYFEIGQKLDISVNNVYKRISLARAILKPKIQAYLEDDFGNAEIFFPLINRREPIEIHLTQGIQQCLQPTLLVIAESDGKNLINKRRQCPYCLSIHTSKNGKKRGKQNYICPQCDRQFVDSSSIKGYSPEVRELGLKLFAEGIGYRAVGRKIGVSHNTVKNWVNQSQATS